MYDHLIDFSFLISICSCTPETGELDNQITSTSPLSNAAFTMALYIQTRANSLPGLTTYLTVYSPTHQQDQPKPFNLTATHSFRNGDLTRALQLTKILHYHSKEKLVKILIDNIRPIKPMVSAPFVIKENDLSGNGEANFIINWKTNKSLVLPVVDVVLTNTSQQGVLFVTYVCVPKHKTATDTLDNP